MKKISSLQIELALVPILLVALAAASGCVNDVAPIAVTTTAPTAVPTSAPTTGATSDRESWLWVYNTNNGWPSEMTEVAANAGSFTHLSPTFYTLNYASSSAGYASGVSPYVTCPGGVFACTGLGSNNFGTWAGATLTTKSFTTWGHGLGLKVVPAIYAGASNSGNDKSVQNILCGGSASGCAAQTAFITAMVAEAVTNGYDGYNLDWEVGSGVTGSYAASFVHFVDAFKAALVASLPEATLSVDAITSNVNGTYCSSNSGYLDFGLLAASSIDRIMIEDYASIVTQSGWTAPTACEKTGGYGSTVLNDSSPIGCDASLTGMMTMMCSPNLGSTSALAFGKAVIGLEASVGGTNPVAGVAFADLKSFGFTKVAVWPQYDDNNNPFMSTEGMVPSTDTWYGLLKNFLSQ